MRRDRDVAVALCVLAAAVGAGFASGREICVFFAEYGWASWLGIPVAGVGMGLMTALVTGLARATGEKTLPGLYGAVMNPLCGNSVHMLYAMLMLLVSAAMLAASARLGELALPIPRADWMGALLTLAVAAVCARRCVPALTRMGAVLAAAIFVFYVAAALDGREVRVLFTESARNTGGVAAVPAAVLLGALYASLNAALTGGVACLASGGDVRPKRVGLYVGAGMTLLLCAANAAILRGGAQVRTLLLPSVALAARWGAAGFWICLTLMWLAVLTTLCACLGALTAQGELLGIGRKARAPLACGLTLALAMAGMRPLVDVGYPLMSWLCAMVLLALIPFRRDF